MYESVLPPCSGIGLRLPGLAARALPLHHPAVRHSVFHGLLLLLLLFAVLGGTQGLVCVSQVLLCPVNFLEIDSLCLAQAGQRLNPSASVSRALVLQVCTTVLGLLGGSAVPLMAVGK